MNEFFYEITLRNLLRKPIVIIGMMGSGKSTIGKRLAYKLNLQFYDTDSMIEDREGLSVIDIHDFRGETYFRQKETEVIDEVLKYGVTVISTGGDSFMSEPAREMILNRSTSIWLKTDSKTILERVSRRNTRPNMGADVDVAYIEQILAEREPIYNQASIIIESSDLDAHHVLDTILVKLKQHLEATVSSN